MTANADQRYLVLDYETRSKADLKLVGGYEYARHPSTQILCVAWRLGTFHELKEGRTDTNAWSPALPSSYGELKQALLDPGIMIVAHNAFFEKVTTRFVLSKIIHDRRLKEIPDERWICTASMARSLAFPGKLAEACAALDLSVQKDMGGHKLMLKMSKPRKATAKNSKTWHQKKSDLLKLLAYCRTDVDAEVALFTSIPFLSEAERRVWLLDQKINMRGFHADRPLIKKTLKMIGSEMTRLERETIELTGGRITSTAQRDATLKFLAEHGLELPNLQKKTVEDALLAGLATGKALRLLRLRQDASKTSTAKYEAFEARSRTDGRIRDNLVFFGASTGRWSGAGVQVQNLPRPSISQAEIELAIATIGEEDEPLETIRFHWGNPLNVFSSVIRSLIVASPGKELFGGDFAGIEVRVLFWMAKHDAGLRAYIEGRDLYREIAAKIYGVRLEDVTKAMREVGKRAILGCGYGMGKDKFFETCKAFGQEVEPELAEAAVNAYRSVHAPVVRMWSNVNQAAIAAVKNRGKRYTVNRTAWWMDGKYLYCGLPSGRRLAYYGPEIRQKATPWGEMRETLYHWDRNPRTRKWEMTGTYGGRLVENCVQASARCFMVGAMLRLEDAGYEILLTVHDEILAEREKGTGSEKEFGRLMAEKETWGADCPIAVETFSGERYRK